MSHTILVDNLHYIPDLVRRWNGPTSIAVFAPNKEAPTAIFAIEVLRRCIPQIKKFVTFHILYPTAMPPDFDEIFDCKLAAESDCNLAVEAVIDLKKRTNYNRMDKIKYPQNTLRNLARDTILTKLFLVVDIDTLPNAKLRQKFDTFAKKVLYQ